MTWQVILSPEAQKDLRHMPRERALQVIAALKRLATSWQGDVKRLQGKQGEWRLRVGDYRVRFILDYKKNILVVLHVLPRGGAYHP